MPHKQPPKTFNATQSADLPAALCIKDALRYTEHAVRPTIHNTSETPASDRKIRYTRTVCGKRILESWHISSDTFAEKANIYTHTLTSARAVNRETNTIEYHRVETLHINGTCCEECIRQVFGYVKCIDCPVDYLATPMIYPNWIKSTRRASRCETHQREYESSAHMGETESDNEYVIVVHQENRHESAQLTAHVAPHPVTTYSMEFTNTLCGTMMNKLRQYSRRGFLLDTGQTIRYTPRNLEPFRRGTSNVCKRCEAMMRERGYATHLPPRNNPSLAIVGIQ